MSMVLIIALVALAAVGGTVPAGASAGHRESRPAIATAPTVAAWSLAASAQTLQIEQAGSDTSLKAPEPDCGGGAGPEAARVLDGYCSGFGGHLGGPEFGGLGEAGIWLPAQEVDGLGQTWSRLAALEAPVTLQAPKFALQAPETTQSPDRWVFSFSPYVWFPTTSATLTSGPLSTSLSVGPFQYGIPFGAMGHFTGIKGKWGFFGDLVYANSFYGGLGPRSDTSVLSTAWIGEAGVTYRLTGQTRNLADWGSVKEPPAVDAYIGGRLFSITQNITVAFRDLGTSVSASSSGTFTSPIIGIRAQFDLSEKWSLLLDGNIGGFGVDDTSFAWEAFAVFAYKTRIFSVPATLDIGARAIYMNVQSGPNLQVNETLYGPLVGLTLFW